MFLQIMLLRKESIYGRGFTNRGMPHHRPFSFFFFYKYSSEPQFLMLAKYKKICCTWILSIAISQAVSHAEVQQLTSHITPPGMGCTHPPLGRCSLKWTWKRLAPKCASAEQPSRKRQKLKCSENIFWSRFNHSCRPLAEFSWNPVRKKQEVRVVR